MRFSVRNGFCLDLFLPHIINLIKKNEMKKFKSSGLVLLLTIALLSCSKDGESTSDSTSLILPKKINYIENTSNDKVGKDTYFTYNGNKIVSDIYDGKSKNIYTYTGDFITKVESFDYAKLTYTMDYSYTNGKLTSVTEKETSYPSVTTNFIHNTDGTVLYSSIYGKGKLTFKDGNLIEDASENNGTETYEYDTKNNPFKNVLGVSLLLYNYKESGAHLNTAKNNYIKRTDKYNGIISVLSTSIITYNSNGYPIVDSENNEGLTGFYASYKYYYD